MVSEDTFTLHPSSSALEVLVNAGVDPIAAEQMLSRVELPSTRAERSEDERGRASFEERMLPKTDQLGGHGREVDATPTGLHHFPPHPQHPGLG